MKIAIPTNDRVTITKRTGRAAEFGVFNIENSAIISVEYRKNTHSHKEHEKNEENHHKKDAEQPHEEHSHSEIIALLKDIDILLVRAVGKFMKSDLQNGKIPYQLVKTDVISEIITDYLAK